MIEGITTMPTETLQDSSVSSIAGSGLAASSNDRYLVANPREITGYLRSVIKERVLCAVRAAGKPESFLSQLIAVRDDGMIVFDAPRAPVIVRSLVASACAMVEFTLQDVRIAFEAELARLGDHEGDAAIFLKPPQRIYRFQRRDNYRVTVPARRPVRISLDPADAAVAKLRLADLSCGGASVMLRGALEAFPIGREFDAAQLQVEEDADPFTIAVRIRHAVAVRMAGTIGELRIGVQFVRTPAGFEPAVARLVNEIARDLMRIKQA